MTIKKIGVFIATVGLITVLMVGCGSNNNRDENNNTDPEPVPPGQGTSTLKKTGQTQSYDTDGNVVTDGSLKDDGYYQKGVTPSYARDSSKESVTDNITGLMWQDDEAAATVKKVWADTETYCSNDVSTGGYDDWRLPARVELVDLANYGRYAPAIDTEFQNTATSNYWSSTASLFGGSYSGNEWIVNFYTGGQNDDDEKSSHFIRCIRGGESDLSSDARFSRANGIVTDSKTNLQWQDDYSDNDDGRIKNAYWADAISYCEALSLDGGNWRLPNLNELTSVVDDTETDPATSRVFLHSDSWSYWSSTTVTNHTINAWVVEFTNGHQYNDAYKHVVTGNDVRCVRDGE